jgi:hypothetical protein
MANKVQSKCLCCGDIFTVDVRNRGRQKYCAKGIFGGGRTRAFSSDLGSPKRPHAFSESENLPELHDCGFVIPRSACKLLHIFKLPPYRRHLRQMRHRHQFPSRLRAFQ